MAAIREFVEPEKRAQSWNYPNSDYERKVPKPQCGTVVIHPVPKLENGRAIVERYEHFIVDDAGRLHLVSEWELTASERGRRKVVDDERLAYLFDPYRQRTRPESAIPDDFVRLCDEEGRPLKGALTKLGALLTQRLQMPKAVRETLVQREPGEEG